MPSFRTVTVSPSLEQVRTAVVKNGGCIAAFGGGFDCPEVGTSPEGWSLHLIDTRGTGNGGVIVAAATTKQNFEFQLKHTLEYCERRRVKLARLARAALAGGDPGAFEFDPETAPRGGREVLRPILAEMWHNPEEQTREISDYLARGNVGTWVLPVLLSPLYKRQGLALGTHTGYRWFAHSCMNYINTGDGRHRVWCHLIE